MSSSRFWTIGVWNLRKRHGTQSLLLAYMQTYPQLSMPYNSRSHQPFWVATLSRTLRFAGRYSQRRLPFQSSPHLQESRSWLERYNHERCYIESFSILTLSRTLRFSERCNTRRHTIQSSRHLRESRSKLETYNPRRRIFQSSPHLQVSRSKLETYNPRRHHKTDNTLQSFWAPILSRTLRFSRRYSHWKHYI